MNACQNLRVRQRSRRTPLQVDRNIRVWFVWHEGRERPYGRLSVLRPTPRDVRIPRLVKEVRHVGQ